MKAHRLLYHSTLGLRVIQKKKKTARVGFVSRVTAAPQHQNFPWHRLLFPIDSLEMIAYPGWIDHPQVSTYRGTLLIKERHPLGTYSRLCLGF